MKKLAVGLAALLALTACAGEAGDNATPDETGPESAAEETPAETADDGEAADESDEATTEISATVFAAASLTAVFEEIAADIDANFSFDGSSGLVDQIAGGAPADVFASADQRKMDNAVEQGLIEGDPTMFATNYLVLVTPADNPAGITGLDESLDGSRLVVCAFEVPCGGATQRLAEAVGIELSPVSEEASVTDVLGKVTSGEADAGLVYLTDATGAGDDVQTIEIPEAEGDPNTYWIAPVGEGDVEQAQAFIDLIMGDEGRALLEEYGFGPPNA